MHVTRSGGAPAEPRVSAITRVAAAEASAPLGWGAITMALRDLIARSALKKTVETGFVTGISAAITPTGSAISTSPRSGQEEITPAVATRASDLGTSVVTKRSLISLWSARPYPVTCTANRASSGTASRPAAETASTAPSTSACDAVAHASAAVLAASASSLACAIELRSGSNIHLPVEAERSADARLGAPPPERSALHVLQHLVGAHAAQPEALHGPSLVPPVKPAHRAREVDEGIDRGGRPPDGPAEARDRHQGVRDVVQDVVLRQEVARGAEQVVRVALDRVVDVLADDVVALPVPVEERPHLPQPDGPRHRLLLRVQLLHDERRDP